MRPLLFALLLTTCPIAAAGAAVEVREAWIALPAPGVPVAAGYLVLENRGPEPVRLVGVRVAGFAKAEVHESFLDGSRNRMRPRPTLEVAAGGLVRFAPGGLHLMLFDPARPPAVGAVHLVTLTLADGRTLEARAAVRDARAEPTTQHHADH